MTEISRVALFGKLNTLGYKAIEGATVFCKMRGNPYVEIVHWMHQILNNQGSDIHKIIDIELDKLLERIDDLGYKLVLTDSAKDYIAEKGFDQNYGARPLKRAIQKYVEDTLAEEIINSNLEEGDTITMDLDSKTESLKVKMN